MQTLARRKSLNFIISLSVVVVLTLSFAAWQQTNADSPETADEKLASEVELNVPQQLRVAGRHAYSVKAKLSAKSDEPVEGPIFLVVQGTGIDRLFASEPDGVTADDEPYFLILPPNKKLTLAKPFITQKLSFDSDAALRSSERREFKLEFRLTREISRRVADTKSKDKRIARGNRITRIPRVSGRTSEGNAGRRRETGVPNADDPAPAGQEGNQAKEREPFELKADITDKEVKRVMKIQEKYTPELLKKEGVVGTATGVNIKGELVIRVYASRHGVAKTIQKELDGVPVQPKVVGRFRPLYQPPQDKRGRAGGPGGAGLQPVPEVEDPQTFFQRPIPIGVSGINLSLMGCGTGTIGSRLKGADGSLYALSNNHVFADENAAPIGDPILQPGPLDNNCVVDAQNSIGTLAAFIPITFDFNGTNQVDAAIAHVTAATMSNRTSPGGYGLPNSSTLPARLGMKVKKMGRTTSLTTGRVTALNAIAPVGYANGFAVFANQIEITKPIIVFDETTGELTFSLEEFSMGGDSGSLVVTTYGNNPVGLLFAGSVFFTLANPIDLVLEAVSQELGQRVSIDGGPSNVAP